MAQEHQIVAENVDSDVEQYKRQTYTKSPSQLSTIRARIATVRDDFGRRAIMVDFSRSLSLISTIDGELIFIQLALVI